MIYCSDKRHHPPRNRGRQSNTTHGNGKNVWWLLGWWQIIWHKRVWSICTVPIDQTFICKMVTRVINNYTCIGVPTFGSLDRCLQDTLLTDLRRNFMDFERNWTSTSGILSNIIKTSINNSCSFLSGNGRWIRAARYRVQLQISRNYQQVVDLLTRQRQRKVSPN